MIVIHRKFAPYHPKANGKVESSNKIMCTILTKIIESSRIDCWELKLNSTLWAYRVAYKTSIDTTPFNMIYGLDTIFPVELLLPTLQVAQQLEWNGHELFGHVDELE